MKVSINKDYVTCSQMEKVKADAKEFRARYTDGDLKRTFEEATDCSVYGDIIKCTVEAFSSSWGMDADTSFFVSQVIESPIGFEKFSYYCDMNLTVSMDPLLLTHKSYWERRK